MKNLYIIMAFLFISVLGMAQPQRVVLIEEGTGTWCQYCPRGEVYASELAEQYPGQYVFVAIHFNDPMQYSFYGESSGLTGLPSGNVDRVFETSMDPFTDLEADMNSRLSVTPAANVSVETTWDENTREIGITISATMFEDLSGDYRLAAIVMEDGITGPAPSYDQSNSYSGGDLGPMGGYENLPSPVSASVMVYDHVARNLPGGYEGDPNSMPGSLSSGQTYSYNYSYILPEEYDETYVHVAGIMVDNDNDIIMNAGAGDYILGYNNAPPFFQSNPSTIGFIDVEYQYNILVQDPDHDDLTITALTSLPPGLELNTTGNGTAVLSGVPTETGTFNVTLNVNDGNWDIEQSFQIEFSEAAQNWILIGNQGFSDGDLYNNDIRIKPDGTPVVMTLTSNDQMQLYEYNGSNWIPLGNNLPANAFHASFCLDTDGKPLAFDASGRVYRLIDNQWEQVGGNLPDANNIYSSITVDGNDQIHVVYFLPPSATVAYYFDGNEWVSSGSVTDGVAVWNKLKTSPDGTPMLMYGTDGTSILYSELAEWDGSEWNLLGGGYIEPNAQTVFDHDFTVTSTGEIFAALTIGTTQSLNVYKIVDGAWQMVTENVSAGATENCNIGANANDEIIVAYRDENEGGRTSSKILVNDNWEFLGLPGFTNPAGGQVMAIDNNGVPYVAYEDQTLQGAISCRKYTDISTSILTHNKNTQQISLYPNPNKGQFTVNFEEGELLEVYDMGGRRILQQNITRNQKQVELEINAPSGIYLVRILHKGSYSIVRLVIE